jgi:tetratricopeptide (TPR) repeat protein/DNA-binding response OmpR family regulator
VLLVGSDADFEPALRMALSRHRVYVETASPEAAVETVIVTAPDLVLLTNEAAADGGRALLAKLSASPGSSVVPVALLDDNPALEQRLRAFRHGAAAVIPRSASIDAIAEQIARLAREIPERGGEVLGQVGEATLAELVSTLEGELRSGILSVQPGDSRHAPVRLVLGSGRPLAAFIEDFVARVRRHVVHAEPLKYELDERAFGTIKLLDPNDEEARPPTASMEGQRIALVDDDAARADGVAEELRALGATVVVTDLEPSSARFMRLRQVDPQVLILGESHLQGRGYELIRRMRSDARLRWASLLVVKWDEIWSDTWSAPRVDSLAAALDSLAEAERSLLQLAQQGEAFDTRLEITGPARLLRALLRAPRALRLVVHNPRLVVSLDLAEGLLVGASARAPEAPSPTFDGALALAGLMVLSSGRVHIEPAKQPAATNVLSTIDVALAMADAEAAPIAPSIPAPHGPQPPPAPPRPFELDEVATSAAAKGLGQASRVGARLGITPPIAALLLALSCAQGLLLAWFFGSLFGRSPVVDAPSAPESAQGLAVASARAAASSPPPSPSAVSPAPAADLGARTPRVQEPPAVPAPRDETGYVAPSCEAMLAPLRLEAGSFPGAAYEQQAKAAKALVRGKLDEAQLAYCKAARWDAKNPQTRIDLAQLFLLRRDGAAAAQAAREAIALDPSSARARSLLGDGLVRLGDHEGAKAAWLLAAGTTFAEPSELRALLERSLTEAEGALRKKDIARAERFFRRAIVLEPDSLPAARGLAACSLQLGDAAAAARFAQRALSREPRDAQAHIILGDALMLQGDAPGAEQAWQAAARLEPGDNPAQNRLRRLRTAR